MKKINDIIFKSRIIPVILLIVWSIAIAKFSVNVINGANNYDMRFHLARIVGLAQSIHNGDILPNINNIFSWGTGYASNMFYGNWQLYIPALVFIKTQNILFSFSVLAFTIIALECFTTYYFIGKIVNNKQKSFWIALITPCFFPLYSFGMTMVVGLVPILIYALYKVIYEDKTNPILLAIIVSLLIQSHILSTLILAIVSLIFIVFNIDKIRPKHILSFVVSAVLGLLLSSGFIIQYLEQIHSQKFYFSWKTRDFPISPEKMFILDKNFNSGFTAITNYFDLPLKLIAIYYALNFKNLQRISKALLCTSFTMYFAMTSLLPWQSVLRYTFLGIIQYTERLSFFTPILMLIVIMVENSPKVLKMIAISVSIMYFGGLLQSEKYLPNEGTNTFMADNLRTMQQVYKNPLTMFVNPVGDEYYTIDINHGELRDRKFADVSNMENVIVNKVKYGYNKIELNYKIIDTHKGASVVIPRIYYKGYVANYSNGGSGSQPILQQVKKTKNEIKESHRKSMPKTSYKVLNNGKIYLKLEKSGKVLVEYKKTNQQKIGYMIELISWVILFIQGMLFKKTIETK